MEIVARCYLIRNLLNDSTQTTAWLNYYELGFVYPPLLPDLTPLYAFKTSKVILGNQSCWYSCSRAFTVNWSDATLPRWGHNDLLRPISSFSVD